MRVVFEGEPKEIAALVLAAQERRFDLPNGMEQTISECVSRL